MTTRLLVTRHGDADYPVRGVLSDEGGWLTDKGKAQVDELARSLTGRGVTGVYSSTMQRAVESARRAAAILGVSAQVVDGLQEYSVGQYAGLPYGDPRPQQVFNAWLAGDLSQGLPGGETGQQVVDRYRIGLDEVADATADGTALVFSHGGVMSLVIPRLSVNVRDDLAAQRFLPNCVPAEVEVDGEQWRVISWPGSTDKSVV
ncbi:histidine phosphatase family protein [Calidifontibacter sp. DB0510]|uniref:Histidine phosphatase family protein n=1 Tax=Metallococcus carri TaxID=1656884 RepID=A0A967AZJ2_9MICO|nr:histidine phosphatase family protein [Metallococcus carri]NHN55297.1 histidine phosphatase family protein [Metallococcus carri]NOP36374.1 histidine phosphatase family protein [Calidifontibacter sp. DB2511S]